MAKTSSLRVYVTQIGFTRWAVAAPNQKAALAAWDVRENLFASGAAKVTKDPRAIELAMKTPGEPVALDREAAQAEAGRIASQPQKRAAGKRADRKAAKPQERKPKAKAEPKPKEKPKPPDRSRLVAAEQALRELRQRAVRERRALLREREALEQKADALEAELDAEEKRLLEAVETERARLEKAGG